jgi:hypothetical protein
VRCRGRREAVLPARLEAEVRASEQVADLPRAERKAIMRTLSTVNIDHGAADEIGLAVRPRIERCESLRCLIYAVLHTRVDAGHWEDIVRPGGA